MKLNELKSRLAAHPEARVRFILPDGRLVEAHAHVTEVAQVSKRFIDCGGTLRDERHCRLQTWAADDVEHRLTAAKLLGILGKAAGSVLDSEELEVDVEHDVGFVTQFPLQSVSHENDEARLHLGERHTACLAPEKCLPAGRAASILIKPLPSFR